LAVVIAAAMAFIVRSERGAEWIGRTAGRWVQRIRPERVDPEVWAQRMKDFRSQVADDLSEKWLGASIALVLMLATESLMFLVAVRAAGVPVEAVSWLFVVGAFCLVYPASSLPAAGLGVLDAALFALLDKETGGGYESQLIAALVIWRALTMILPIVLGGLTLLGFRRNHDMGADDEELTAATADSGGSSAD
ncbi:MAG: lysylphosphatidylglycerol synthase domain-containing protein, partial [Acidimicrobiales bacterium]